MEDLFSVKVFFKCRYECKYKQLLFKYICVVCYLKLPFYCLACSAILNLNWVSLFHNTELSRIFLIFEIEMLLEFQNEMKIEIISFWLMHFEFALGLSNIDLWDTNLSYTNLLDATIPNKHFACLQTSSRHLQGKSSRHLARRLGRWKIVMLKTYWRRLQYKSWRPKNICWFLTNVKSQIKWKRIRTEVCDRKGNGLVNKHISSSIKLDFVKPKVSYFGWSEYTCL